MHFISNEGYGNGVVVHERPVASCNPAHGMIAMWFSSPTISGALRCSQPTQLQADLATSDMSDNSYSRGVTWSSETETQRDTCVRAVTD
jgi:hypothetical protein